ncbi:MAG: GNAT family N-acetyltransferase [Gammaproteobacteria bacterium]|nr:GNAT family N-acetyltransferase [Gammaproteobacteria bacterium]
MADKDWVLRHSVARDIDELMTWFPDGGSVVIWGGPSFRYPFTRHSFVEDICWGRMASFTLRDPTDQFAAFGQLYERFERINLARLVVNPMMRGRGVGKKLVEMLMAAGRSFFECPEYSLFVFRDNTMAYECYKSMGFSVTDYPQDMPHADVCYYLTRPVAESTAREAKQQGDDNDK